jgi:3-dehydroquinate synthase
MRNIRIAGLNPYTVHIGVDVLHRLPELLEAGGGRLSQTAFIVTDRNVAGHYLKAVQGALKDAGWRPASVVLKPGETLKSHSHLVRLLRTMVRAGLARDSVVVGLGGGVIGDLAGFAASIFMRGCAFVQVPTSLLAQVDSSVGGKVGINLPEGKNLVGSFYNPLLVLADIGTLRTLPEREFLCGLAEIVKYGLIRDRTVFDRIEALFAAETDVDDRDVSGTRTAGGPETGLHIANRDVKRLLLRDADLLLDLITESVRIKGAVVSDDEREEYGRMVLNFGHTFGHAAETLTGYRRFLHGEAVLLGMKIAVSISAAAGRLGEDDKNRALGLLDRFTLPPLTGISAGKLYTHIDRDKKKRKGRISYILLEKIGSAVIETEVAKKTVLRCIEDVLKV